VADDETRRTLAEIDTRYGVVNAGNGVTSKENEGEIELEEGWPAYDLASDARFEDLVSRRYRRHLDFDTATYIDLLASTSGYRILADSNRDQLFGEVTEFLNRRGETLTLNIVTDLFLGRTASPTSSPSDIE